DRKRGSQTYSFRVSTASTTNGEKIVLRIAEEDTNLRSFDELGMSPEQIAVFESLIALPNGVIVVTGPTGSGKTTLLYSTLERIDVHSLNVVTIEDPVEYNLPSINQIEVKEKIGLTFAATLRSLLRQDPDVIIIGE